MFQEIFQHIEKMLAPNEVEKIELTAFFKSMEDSTPKLKEKLTQIGNKYKFENLHNLKTPTSYDTTNTLFFWRESFNFSLSIALDEEDIDNNFTLFINEEDIYNPLFEFETPGLEKACFDVYHSWLGFYFQSTKLYENGIPMGITVNSSITSYYFNDFSYANFSKFHELYAIDKRVTRPFVRDLTLEEIFIRTHLIKFPYKRIVLFSSNLHHSEKTKLENSILEIEKLELNSNFIITAIKKQLKKGTPYDRKDNTDIDGIIKYMESAINKGFKFNLKKCKLEI